MIAVAAALLALASPVVDRTLSCRPVVEGYPDPAGFLDVDAAPRLGSRSPSMSIYAGPGGDKAVAANVITGPMFGRGTGQVAFSRLSCSAASTRIPLVSTGLRGGVTRLGDRYKCDVPARILVRVRAVFTRPVTLRAQRANWVARGMINTGEIAVTTYTGRKPIAYLEVDDATGRARIFTSRTRCFRNR